MSMGRMMGTHSVDLLTEQVTQGQSLGLGRSFVYQRTIKCRMVPMGAEMVVKLGLNAQEMPHQMYSTTDPQLTERNRVRWQLSGQKINQTAVFRVKGIPQNPHGQNRFWITNLVMKSEDNTVPVTGTPQELP